MTKVPLTTQIYLIGSLTVFVMINNPSMVETEIVKEEKVDLTTPENTWHSFVKAMSEGDYEVASECVSKRYSKWLKKNFSEINISYHNKSIKIREKKKYRSYDRFLITFTFKGKTQAYWVNFVKTKDDYIMIMPEEMTKDWVTKETRHFVCHYRKERIVSKSELDTWNSMRKLISSCIGATTNDIELLDKYYEKVSKFLNTEIQQKINYYICCNKEELQVLIETIDNKAVLEETGKTINMILNSYAGAVSTKTNTIYSFAVPDDTAVLYILFTQLGDPPLFFKDGFVLYCWHKLGASKIEVQKQLEEENLKGNDIKFSQSIKEKVMPKLIYLMDNKKFRSQPSKIRNSQALSFTRYLITTYGKDKYMELYRKVKSDNYDLVFKEIYNISCDSLETKWKNYLKKMKEG